MDLVAASPADRAAWIKELGLRQGFDHVGIADVGPHPEMLRYDEWLSKGYHGEMGYLERQRPKRVEPEHVVRGAHSVIVAALDYSTSEPLSIEQTGNAERGWISRYAWGDDYHHVIEKMLRKWCKELETAAPDNQFRFYVDHGPVLEKVFGRYAGVGWMGKHTNLIHPERGSWFFLAVIMTDLVLEHDQPITNLCGTCTACLDACPTQAFVEPYVLDATRCISYLTIESKEAIPEEFHEALGHHVYGCDICQDVCPWNRKPVPQDRPEFQPREGLVSPSLAELQNMTVEEYREKFRRSPIKRRGMERLQATAQRVEKGLKSV